MATKTPIDPRDSIHGEEEAKPRFGLGHGDSTGSYISSRSREEGASPRYGLGQGSSTGQYSNHKSADQLRNAVYGSGKSASPSELANAESRPPASAGDTTGEAATVDRLGRGSTGESKHRKGLPKKGLLARFAKRRMTFGVVTGLVAGVLYFSSILSGPFQTVHFAQDLQEHLESNEDFGNDRSSRMLLYAALGRGAQNGRLGITGNIAANKWEKRLLEQTGLRPVYSEPFRRFVGFEVVDTNKANAALGNLENQRGRNSRKVERSFGKGAAIRTVSEIRTNSNATIVSPNGTIADNTQVIDLSRVSFADRRTWIITIGRSTGTNNATSAIASRLLIKRAGVNFHPFNKATQKIDEAAAKRFKDKRAKEISEGTRSSGGVNAGNTVDGDGDGNPDSPNSQDAQVAEDTKSVLEDFKRSGVVKSGAGATAVVGVFCIAKDYGNAIEDYKFTNIVLVAIRLGMNIVTAGNQVMSGDDIDLGVLKLLNDYFYDEKTKTSWTQAESIRAAQKKVGGIAIPPEADPRNAGEKPPLFNTIDSIPGLGTTCNAVNSFFELPVVKQASGIIDYVASGAINAPLRAAGTNTDELFEKSLKVAAGKSVDPEVQGAALGGIADSGVFFAGNDQAMSMGGAALTNDQRHEIALLEEQYERSERANKTFAERYFDPYDSKSALGVAIMHAPSSPSHLLGSLTNPVTTFSNIFSSAISNFQSKAHAAHLYDYGIPKFGWSIQQQKRDLFENPYENAKLIEQDLDRLNEEYSECFGMKVTADDSSGVHIEVTEEKANPFKVVKKDKCDPSKNQDDRFNQYRFYLADAVTALSLACYEGNDNSCTELGMPVASDDSAETTTEISGDAQELAKRIMESGKVSGDAVDIAQIQAIAQGNTSCNVNPDILKMLVGMVEKNYSMYIVSLNRRCTNTLTQSGTGSYHYREDGGHAIDFGRINGTPSTGGTENDKRFIRDVLEFLPKGSGIGQSGCRSGVTLPSGIREFADDCDHLHIQVPVKRL